MAGSVIPAVLEREALRQLAGVGDAGQGEWREMGDSAFHVRRRLAGAEERQTGPVADIRKTPEAIQRAQRLGRILDYAPLEVLADELGGG